MKHTHKMGPCTLSVALLVALCGSCRFNSDGLQPYDAAVPWDGTGADGTTGDTGVPSDGSLTCTNGEQRCAGIVIELCQDGHWVGQSTCDWGCNPQPAAHCGSPSWAETVNFITDTGSQPWVAGAGTTVIDTDTGDIITPLGTLLTVSRHSRLHYRSGGLPPVLIIGFSQITIPEGARVEVRGTPALALVATDTIVIGGELISTGHPDAVPGAGGFRGGVDGVNGEGPGGGKHGLVDGLGAKSGGGGAGYTGTGGNGATADPLIGDPVTGGSGGSVVDLSTLDGSLIGGSGGGGSNGALQTDRGRGGGGGGSIMLAAIDAVEVSGTGVINVGGGGGEGRGAGAGGGSGGMVLIQSRNCSVAGVIAANGGGGGDIENGDDGATGGPDETPTPGGGSHGGTGGAGSAGSLAGTEGTADGYSNGGGGGGSAGQIRIDSVLSANITGTVSPNEGTVGLRLNVFPTH